MKRIISLPASFVVFFLTFVVPSVLSANSKNIWRDNSCIKEIQGYGMSWHQHVSKVFVGEVVWAQPRKEAEGGVECGLGVGARNVRHKVIEVLMGDLTKGSEIELRHDWCKIDEEKYHLGAKFIIGLNTRVYRKFPEQEPNGAVAWELPLNPENREKAKNFIQCIHDRGIVKAMEKESEY